MFYSGHQILEGLTQFGPNSENNYLVAQRNIKFILFQDPRSTGLRKPGKVIAEKKEFENTFEIQKKPPQ